MTREKEIYKVTLVGSAGNAALLTFKFIAGVLGNSSAMIADAVHSLSDFVTDILVLVFVVLGGIGNIRGSVIAAALLTILPELLRAFSDYRMLVYAIVLILVMIFTNNPMLKSAVGRILPHRKGASQKEVQ